MLAVDFVDCLERLQDLSGRTLDKKDIERYRRVLSEMTKSRLMRAIEDYYSEQQRFLPSPGSLRARARAIPEPRGKAEVIVGVSARDIAKSTEGKVVKLLINGTTYNLNHGTFLPRLAALRHIYTCPYRFRTDYIVQADAPLANGSKSLILVGWSLGNTFYCGSIRAAMIAADVSSGRVITDDSSLGVWQCSHGRSESTICDEVHNDNYKI